MVKDKDKKKKTEGYESFCSKALPAFFVMLSLLLILLPLQRPVNSVRTVLSYIFIPQLRVAHSTAQYLYGVSETVSALLGVAHENVNLKDEIATLKIENAQIEVLRKENERLADALKISGQKKWRGTWGKVAYREPSRHSTVIVDKGSDDGIELRGPVIGVEGGVVGLLGKVIEVGPKTSKILLSSDEEFFATAFLSESRVEGLAAGNGHGVLNIKYIPMEANIREGEKVYTSATSAIFPDGILIGEIASAGLPFADASLNTFLAPFVKLAVDPRRVKEVLILAPVSYTAAVGGKDNV